MKSKPRKSIVFKMEKFSESINEEPGPVYKVIELKNSIEYEIGQRLEKNEAQKLCESPFYNVTIR